MLFLPAQTAGAQSASDALLRQKIQEKTSAIEKLNEEIMQVQTQVNITSREAQTLQSTIRSLDLTATKLSKELDVTSKTIDRTTLTLEMTTKEIQKSEQKLHTEKENLSLFLQTYAKQDATSPVLAILLGGSLGSALHDTYQLQEVYDSITKTVQNVRIEKGRLEARQNELIANKNNLTQLQKKLVGQKTSAEQTKEEKNELLSDTKNKEANFRSLLAQKQEERAQYEKEIFDFEANLKQKIDLTLVPSARSGILSWPLDSVRITQRFGKTSASGRLYVSGTHNGIDMGTPVGTPVKSVLTGTVAGTGNTGLQKGCRSYGNWVLIRHPNGISSIYGHLSSVIVKKGDQVTTGQVVAYSGNTGYSTGPHLHLSVIATEGSIVAPNTASRTCGKMPIPLAPLNAYLDPMEFLSPL
jgi:murein DD-endopeptidase MepM/ murein hydrolase activator NlpD